MFQLSPIGVVHSPNDFDNDRYPFYCPAQIEIKPQFIPALARLEESSHIWVICLFEQQKDPVMQIKPKRINSHTDSFGVFALRSPNHPNPLSLTLTKLNKIEENFLYVEALDAYDGTPVLDIKPYYEDDIVFSPRTPVINKENIKLRRSILLKAAINHHQEECLGLALAIKMALYIESLGLNIQDNDLFILVNGGPCLADTLQGLCRARLANPARFAYTESEEDSCRWIYKNKTIDLSVKKGIPQDPQKILNMTDEDLFHIKISS
ncbi:MAG: tRNA (N6-threonylcarbamoyladenosine(37)-N6)-methyltransferase TrmO [Bacillota bacterium]|jgi:tRNA-Thr(GGU) m(6)t(6)A37 methyltransferase TsaA